MAVYAAALRTRSPNRSASDHATGDSSARSGGESAGAETTSGQAIRCQVSCYETHSGETIAVCPGNACF